jgi:hypothetical protein
MPPARRRGFGLAPVPHYRTTTKDGTHVSCTGCCLPLPLGCLASVLAVAIPAAVSVARRHLR